MVSWEEALQIQIEEYFERLPRAELIEFIGEHPIKIHAGSRTYFWAWEVRVKGQKGEWGDGMFALATSVSTNILGIIVVRYTIIADMLAAILKRID